MADCKTSVEAVGIVAKSVGAQTPGQEYVSRMDLLVGDDTFVVVGHGEAMTDKFALLQQHQTVRVKGTLVSHRWTTPGKIQHTTIQIKADTLEVLL